MENSDVLDMFMDVKKSIWALTETLLKSALTVFLMLKSAQAVF